MKIFCRTLCEKNLTLCEKKLTSSKAGQDQGRFITNIFMMSKEQALIQNNTSFVRNNSSGIRTVAAQLKQKKSGKK